MVKASIVRELAALSSRLTTLVAEVAADGVAEPGPAAVPPAPPAPAPEQLLSAKEIAASTGFTAHHVYDQMEVGKLRSTKFGKYRRSTRRWVDEWIAGGSGAGGDGNKMLECHHETNERHNGRDNGRHH